MERRLAQLDVIFRRRAAAHPAGVTYDFDRLTMEERHELDAIFAKIAGLPPRPNGRPDLSPLSDEELERVYALSERAKEAA